MSAPVVIVGGNAAGLSAASKFKREAPDRSVIVYEKGEYVSYGGCGLPYYVKGEVETLDDLVSVSAETFVEKRDVDLRTGHDVLEIDRENRHVTVDGPEATFEQDYSDLVLSTGARAMEQPFDGMDLERVFTLHKLPDGVDLRRILGMETPAVDEGAVDTFVDHEAPDSVGIIGGGYVGIEMAEAFASHGLEVHIFEMLQHTLQPFGPDAAAEVEEHLRDQGVRLHLDTAVDGFLGENRVEAVAGGDVEVPIDLALVGVGVAPNTELAEAAGIETGPTGAIATDEYGRTNDPHVYAAGDCAEATHVVTGEPDHVPLALTANRAGRAIGSTLGGTETPVGEIAGTAALKAFDLEVSRTGLLDPGRAEAAGFDPVSVTIDAPSRAHYYPGGDELQITMLGDRKSGRVLGASMVGRDRVAKRIDTVAAALHAEMSAEDLSYLDLSYAPPFSPVWDPVLTAAKVLAGKLE